MIGQTISHYKITEKLGEGGMGVVYRADDTKLDRPVALKFLAPHLMRGTEGRQRFEREAKAAAKLDHPNICTVHEIDEVDGQTFIVMAFLDGRPLSERITAGSLEPTEAVSIAIQMAEGLAAAHGKGIVHRDIKPDNVMLTKGSGGLVKLMDFGLAQLAGSSKLTRGSSTMGTIFYMSPEQAEGVDTDHRTDIWSFGVVLYEMVTGQLPFKGDFDQAVVFSIMNERQKPLAALRGDVPEELERIVDKCLAKDTNTRYQSMNEVSLELSKLLRKLKLESEPWGLTKTPREPDTSAVRQGSVGQPPEALQTTAPQRGVWNRSTVAAALVVALCLALAWWWIFRSARVSEARGMIPEIARLADDQHFVDAYRLAEEAEQILGDDPALEGLWPRVSRTISVQTEPPAADVYVRDYTDAEGDWVYLGQTPFEGSRIPLQYSRWRVEKDGYETIEVADRWDARRAGRRDDLRFTLHTEDTSPPGMVHFERGNVQGVRLGTYYIDRYEVTNQQFKEFVEAGGYRNRQYWMTAPTDPGSTVSWSQVGANFRDKTGRPGPATWSLGTYPDGEEEYPVRGVSWYEAAAYAQWAGKDLPTLYHWLHAAQGAWNYMVPMSQIGVEKPGPVGSSGAISAFGVYDIAGNVREWCSTPLKEQRLILGGAWNQPGYYFHNHRAANPSDRSPENGFRCAKYLEPLSDNVTLPVRLELRDYSSERPVDDKTFEIYRRLLSYDRTELNAQVESIDDSAEHWVKEKVTFDAAYGGERVTAYFFKPRGADPPYQVVLYFPGAGAERVDSSERLRGIERLEPIVRSGRAVLYPVYKGTYERRVDGQPVLNLNLFGDTVRPTARRDVAIMVARDVSRSVDYLESRDDVRADQIGYVGYSLGARMASVFLATEKRIRAAVLAHGGLYQAPKSTRMPEVDEINFAPRVTQPALMLNGRFDFSFSVENSQRPLYELLGTPAADKKHVLFDGGHGAVFTNDQIREMLDWFDRYLGAVN